MIPAEVTEQEIEAAEELISQHQFEASLTLLQKLLTRAENDQIRMRLLFGVVTCSTWLNRKETLSSAVEELKQWPDFGVVNAFVVLAQARADVDGGRALEALKLLDGNLAGEVLQRNDFRDWKYEHLFLRGRALVRMARCGEALSAFEAARKLYPDGEFETDMLIDRSNCLLALHRYAEAYDTASEVLARGDEEMATLAMQRMAESRMWQSRVPEALELYLAIQKRPPSRLIDEDRIRRGIANAMTYLERSRPRGKPS